MEATTEVHQWILALFSLVFGGLLITSVVDRIRSKKRDKQIAKLKNEKFQLRDEINYLIRIHRYINPVTVQVNSLSGITWEELLEQGTTTTTFREDEVQAAIRVHRKYSQHCAANSKPVLLFLSPKSLTQSNVKHHSFIAVIDGALGKEQQTA